MNIQLLIARDITVEIIRRTWLPLTIAAGVAAGYGVIAHIVSACRLMAGVM